MDAWFLDGQVHEIRQQFGRTKIIFLESPLSVEEVARYSRCERSTLATRWRLRSDIRKTLKWAKCCLIKRQPTATFQCLINNHQHWKKFFKNESRWAR
ncbi:hypothetical protein JG559_11515 [Enterococcus faecalis]|uniref:Uncharacterized protein n=1 Tax=Enterococcus faecalis TaxID=1351 RepID=A0A974S671_ENTFL|nr:hypothetical protein JG559_11515 [Enterococcus faecalis]